MKKIVFWLCSLLLLKSCQNDHGDNEVDYTTFKPVENPSKFDYCTLNCDSKAKEVDDNGGLHPACFCWVKPPRKEVYGDNISKIIELREIVVKQHNYLRNLTASGGEVHPENSPIPQAANMELLNYDLELEHIARCRGINSFGTTYGKGTSHEPCKKMHDGRKVAQNLAYKSHYRGDLKEWLINGIQRWYNEVTVVPDSGIVDEYSKPAVKEKTGHWSALIWATLNKIGCVFVFHPSTARSRTKGKSNLSYILICDYASDHTEHGANVRGQPIFKRGNSCSACPGNKKCNSEYKALCGESLPIPKDPPYPIMESKGTTWYHCDYSWFGLFLVNFVLHLVFAKISRNLFL